MKQVAAQAGVSLTSVSHVINGTRRVGEVTRTAVLNAIAELGYEVRAIPHRLAAGGTVTVAVVGAFQENPVLRALADEIQFCFEASGHVVLYADTHGEYEREHQIVSALIAHHVDALVVAPSPGWRRHSLRVLRRHRMPFVIIGNHDPAVAAQQFIPAYHEAACALTDHVLESGRSTLAMLHTGHDTTASMEAMTGFLEAHRRRGLQPDPELFVRAYSDPSATRLIATRLLRSRPDIQAVVATSELIATTVIDVADSLAWAVPDRLGVVSFLSGPDMGSVRYPSVTGAIQLVGDIAEAVVNAVAGLLQGSADPLGVTRFPLSIQTGTSCGCGTDAHERAPHVVTHAARSGSGRILWVSGHGRRTQPHLNNPRESEKKMQHNTASHPDKHFPALHIRPGAGWINDPNGIHRVHDTYHMFYQYNPKSPWHNQICWGHATSTDLVHWQEREIALRPEQGAADSYGCWSGVGYVAEDQPSLFYSAVTNGEGRSRTAVAKPIAGTDGWARTGVVAEMPHDPTLHAMRDPFIFVAEGRRWAIHGGGYEDGTPCILLYDAEDLQNWEYVGPLLTGNDPIALAHMPAAIWECPQLVPMGDKWLLVASLWVQAESLMDHLTGVAYLVGSLQTGRSRLRFEPSTGGRFDTGPDFYAPQLFIDGKEILAWGWSWEGLGRSVEEIEAAGYNGSLTFPRRLSLVGGKLDMRVPAELRALRKEPLSPAALASARSFEIAFKGSEGATLRVQDRVQGKAVAHITGARNGSILVDGSLIEVFLDGDVTHTVRHYPSDGFALEAKGMEIEAYALAVDWPDGCATALRPIES